MAQTASETRKKRRWWIYAAGIVGTVAGLGLVVRGLAATGVGRSFVEARIEALALRGQSVTIDGLDGDLFGRFTAERLTVSDKDGTWLTVTDVAFDWSPTALLSRKLVVNDVDIADIAMMRRPILTPSAAPASNDSGGGILRGGRLGMLTIDRLETGADFTGEQAAFSAAASGELASRNWTLDVELEPVDASGDRVDIDLSWQAGDVPRGTVRLDAPAGGLVASLARLDPDQSMQVTLDASGDRDGWALTAAAEIGAARALSADLTGTANTATGTVVADLTHHPLTAEIATRIGPELNLTLDRAAPDGRDRLALTARAERLTASISTDASSASAPIAIAATLTDLGNSLAVPGIEGGQVRLSGFTRTEPGDWAFSGTLSAGDLQTSAGTIQALSGPIDLDIAGASPRLNIALQAEGAALFGVATPLLGTAPIVNLDGQWHREDNVIELGALQISGAHAALSASGALDQSASDLTLNGDIVLDGVASGAFPLELSGRWRTRTRPNGRPEIRFTANATSFQSLPDSLAPLVGDDVSVTATVRPEADGAISVPAYAISAQGIDVSGTASRAATGTITAAADGTIAALANDALSVEPITLSASATGDPADLALDILVQTPGVQTSAIRFVGGEARLIGRLQETSRLAGTLTTTAMAAPTDASPNDARAPRRSEPEPLTLQTDFAVSTEQWSLSDLAMTGLGLTATGTASSRLDPPSALRADLTLSGRPSIDERLERIDLRAALDGNSVDIIGAADVAAIGALGASKVALSITGTPQDAVIKAQLDSAVDTGGQTHPLAMTLDGTASGLQSDVTALSLSPRLTLGDLSTTVIEPIDIRRSSTGNTLSIAGKLGMLNGDIDLAFDQQADQSRLAVTYRDLSVAPLLSQFDRPVLGGRLSGDIIADTRPGVANNRISWTGSVSALQPSGQSLDPVTITHSLVGTAGDGLTLSANAKDDTGLDLTARLNAPLTADPAWPGLAWPEDGEATYAIAGGGEIETLVALALPPTISLSGTLDIGLAGTLPGVQGTTRGRVALANGRLEQGDLGFVLSAITSDAAIAGGELTLNQFSGTGPSGGTLSGDGRYRLGDDGSTLALTAANLFIIDREDIRARASGDMTLEETADGYAIAGDFMIDRADIDPSRIEGAGYQTLDVVFPEDLGDTPRQEPESATITLDIDLDAPRRVFVTGQGLDAEFSLSASIRGPAGAPMVEGTAAIVRGRFDFAGKRFTFEDSRVDVTGDPSEAVLDLRAVRQTADITAVISITGTPASPEITLSSEPELPEDEILSRVLFGRSPTDLSALEAAQLAQGLSSLSGGGALNIMGQIEDALGLDALDLSQGADGGTNVTTGKYLSEDVYLQVRTDGTGQPTLIIEWTPLENLEIETDLTPTEGQGASIQWRREFD